MCWNTRDLSSIIQPEDMGDCLVEVIHQTSFGATNGMHSVAQGPRWWSMQGALQHSQVLLVQMSALDLVLVKEI